MKKNLVLLALATVVSLLLLEAGTAVGTRLGLLPVRAPSYSMERIKSPPFWRDMNPDFGTWRNPHATLRHNWSCFDVTYTANSHGARDVERTLQSDRPRVVVLGDSMTEGFGVADGQRFSDLLERETGIEHLNFGVAGFGTTQSYLAYKTLASRFSHSAVLIGLLPANDFWDNDYQYGKQVFSDRYRPYLVGEYPAYRLVYHKSSLEQSTFREQTGWSWFAERFLSEFTHSYNALNYLKRRLVRVYDRVTGKELAEREREIARLQQRRDWHGPYSAFYDYRKEHLDLVKYTLEQIKRIAGDRPVIIALLPYEGDFQRYQVAGAPPLSAAMKQFAAENGMILVDLLTAMQGQSGDWKSYFLSCDDHFSARGHAVAARYLGAALAPLYLEMARSGKDR